MRPFNHTALKTTLLVLLAFTALTALICGLMFIMHPDGSSLSLSTELLNGTPFHNYTIPGLMLLVFIGLVSLAALFMEFTNNKKIYNWAIAAGVFMIVWLLLQFVLIPTYYWLYIFYMVIGILIILISFQLKGKAII